MYQAARFKVSFRKSKSKHLVGKNKMISRGTGYLAPGGTRDRRSAARHHQMDRSFVRNRGVEGGDTEIYGNIIHGNFRDTRDKFGSSLGWVKIKK